MLLRPMPFRWDGEAMVPVDRFVALARRQFTKDVSYVLEPHEAASHKDRAHYFASIRSAWENLDSDAVARYPNPEALRKWALIKTGWRIENFTVCDTAKDALRLAAFLRDLEKNFIIVVQENVVRTYVARTQKVGRQQDGFMTQEEWRQSKQDVLDVLSGSIGITPKTLEKQGAL